MQHRRQSDRRTRRGGLRLKERRTGFDRRKSHALLAPLRNDPLLLGSILVAFIAMSVADGVLTAWELRSGLATEGNPALAPLIASSPTGAALFKLAATLAVAAGIWTGRRYRGVLAVSIFAVAVYTAVLAYHLGSLYGAGALWGAGVTTLSARA